jgi:hypothetical protein
MKRKIILIIIIMICIWPLRAQAGKPAQQPYPPPLQPTVYPRPDPDSLIPDAVLDPNEDCTYEIGVPCALGLFTVDGGLTRWYVTVDGPIDVEPLSPILCIMWRDLYGRTWNGCIDLHIHSYRPYRNLYVSNEWRMCGHGNMYYVSVNYITGQIPLPNEWMVDCWFLPFGIQAN